MTMTFKTVITSILVLASQTRISVYLQLLDVFAYECFLWYMKTCSEFVIEVYCWDISGERIMGAGTTFAINCTKVGIDERGNSIIQQTNSVTKRLSWNVHIAYVQPGGLQISVNIFTFSYTLTRTVHIPYDQTVYTDFCLCCLFVCLYCMQTLSIIVNVNITAAG